MSDAELHLHCTPRWLLLWEKGTAEKVNALDTSQNSSSVHFVCRETIWCAVSRLGDKYSNVTSSAVLYSNTSVLLFQVVMFDIRCPWAIVKSRLMFLPSLYMCCIEIYNTGDFVLHWPAANRPARGGVSWRRTHFLTCLYSISHKYVHHVHGYVFSPTDARTQSYIL